MASDPKVRTFRTRHEMELQRLITRACCIVACTNEGNLELWENEMDAFAAAVLSLVATAKRVEKKKLPVTHPAIVKLVSGSL